MRLQAEPRIKKRVPCALQISGERYPGMVLNVSPRGLFVQTSAKAPPGAEIGVRLNEGSESGIAVQGRVVQGGFGLRIESASEAYFAFLAGVMKGASPAPEPASASRTSAPATPEPTPAVHESAPAAHGSAASAAQRYRVRLRATGGSRSRTRVVEADSAQEAGERALAECGDGWRVLEVAPDA